MHIHVTYLTDRLWAVAHEGAEQPAAVVPTQREASALAKEIVQSSPQGGEVFIHGKDGRVWDRHAVALGAVKSPHAQGRRRRARGADS